MYLDRYLVKIIEHELWLSFRGINFILSALVFNIFPTIFEVLLVSGILVCILNAFQLANSWSVQFILLQLKSEHTPWTTEGGSQRFSYSDQSQQEQIAP